MEMGEKTHEEMSEIISAIELDKESMQELEDTIKVTKENLAHDMVQRRQNRFNKIEEKVNNIQESTEESVDISMVDLDKLFGAIRKELASSDQFQKSEYGSDKIRYFLNVSQFLFIHAMVMTMTKRKSFEYRHDTGLPAYQNIQLLDFNDMITQVKNFSLDIQSAKQKIRDELIEKLQKKKEEATEEQKEPTPEGEGEEDKIPEIDEIMVPVDQRVSSISEIINLLSKSAQYCCVSKSWVLLENIVKYTWNIITYELASPLELSQTDAYKDIFLITECVLNLLSQAKLSDDSNNSTTVQFTLPTSTRTVKFADETVNNEKSHGVNVNEADLKFYSGFIAFTIQCLFVAEKWESMVDLADTANKQFSLISPELDDNMAFLSSYLYQFRIYGEDKLYATASQKTAKVKEDLEIRIKKYNLWKSTSKKSKSRTALLTGEVPKEEIQFRKDKLALEKEIFRLEVHQTILRSDKNQSEKELDKIKRGSNRTIEALRQSRKLYQKYGIETRNLEEE